jgi:Na+-transporting NADH:ubiquinone oxidoreductase subunit NqrC
MLLKRAREEILLTKKEMLNYLQFLVSKHSSLLQFIQQNVHEEDKFAKGKKVLSAAEIQRLHLKIKESLQLFNLYSDGDFINLINGSDFPQENINTEFELESSDEDDNCENDSSDDQTVVSDQFSFNSESESEVADEQSSTNESE